MAPWQQDILEVFSTKFQLWSDAYIRRKDATKEEKGKGKEEEEEGWYDVGYFFRNLIHEFWT